METAPTLDTVLQALNALYHNPDVVGKEKASVWLGELQRSVFAWQIADQLLQLSQDVESCYFAAQTMRTKIQLAFHELPPNSHQSLRDSLLTHIGKVTPETQAVIVTQLCLALADLALQMASWKCAAKDLIEKFGNNVQHLHFLLEVLTVMPEEINSRSLRLGANRRKELTEELASAAPLVLQLLTACTENGACTVDERLQIKVFRCLGSWFSISAIPQDQIVNSKLLMVPFMALMNKDCPNMLHEAACDCICSAFYSTENQEKNSLLAQSLFQGVMNLPDAYHMSVADEDLDKSINYCRIFTEMGESFLETIAYQPNQGLGDLRTVELILTCVGHHQYEVAEITFNFWYRLSEILYQVDKTDLNECFKPYIQRLIVALCRHCQFDPDHDGIPKESGDFGDFRTRVSELIKDVVFLVGSSSCFAQMFENLKSQATAATWDQSEAALFVMCAVAKNILLEEKDIVPQVLQAILSMPETAHIAVRYTSTQLVGELAEWMDQNPECIDLVLQFLLSCLKQPQLATVAATAIQNVCTACRDRMGTAHFPSILQTVQAVDELHVSNNAAIGLLKGAAMILARLSHDEITEGLKKLCFIQTSCLSKLLETNIVAKYTVGTGSDPTLWLDRLAAIFRHTNPTVMNGEVHPCKPVIEEIWPVLSKTCDLYQDDVRVIERCCRCIRFAVRCVGKGSASLLTPLVTQMVQLYEKHTHSCFLYLGSILVDEYGTETGCVQGLLDMLQAFCRPTFYILEERRGLQYHPDTVDDLFRLCTRFVQRSPVPFLQCTVIKAIICCAIAACGLDHRDANASVMKFLTELAKASRNHEDKEDFQVRKKLILEIFAEHGAALMQSIINACVFCLPSYMIVDVADVVMELMVVDRPAVCKWLEAALKALPTESSGGSVTATHKQLTDFHKAVTIAEEAKQVSVAIRDFARLYR
ncbi:transportin-3-like [Lineus longissimus]|uniref:transportin-3-like n=1 Tax=Lineus longissimus TaxID=88925 RepID=UPI002B4EC886